MTRLAAVILAAGEGRRFKGCKQLAVLENETLIERSMRICHHVFPQHSYIVLGYQADKLASQLAYAQTQIVVNPDWRLGISASIRCAIQTIGSDYDAVLFVLADQVRVSEKSLQRLQAIFMQRPNEMICSRYANQLAVPAIFPQRFFADLLALEGDRGAKYIIQQHIKPQGIVDIPEAEFDIDTQQDLDNVSQQKET